MRAGFAAGVIALTLVAGCGSSDNSSSDGSYGQSATTTPAKQSSATTPAVTASIQNMAFTPPTITVRVGQKITWTNQDPLTHTVTSDQSGGPKSPMLQDGDRYSWTPKAAGTFNYICTVHPNMTGKVIVKP